MLQHLLREETIHLDLQGSTTEELFADFVSRLPAWSLKEKEKKEVVKLLTKREAMGTTAMGGGVALPHCIYGQNEMPLVALGISREGFPFSSLDGAPVYLIMLVIAPESEQAYQSLKTILHDAGRLFRDRFLKERLKISGTREEALEILLRESQYLSTRLQAC